jgi:hypothetical protein
MLDDVPIGVGIPDNQRNTIFVGDGVVFTAQLSANGRVWASLFASPRRANASAVDKDTGPIDCNGLT